MRIGATIRNKTRPSVIVGFGCLIWTGYLYANFLSWLGVEASVQDEPFLVVMSLSWAIGLGLLPLTLWAAWLAVGQIKTFLVIHTLIFVVITAWVIWLLLSFERPDSWTCIHSQQFDLLCLFWWGLLLMLFVTSFEFLADENTIPRRDLILMVNLATVLNFNALPWMANLHCGGFFLDENWRNFDLLFYTVVCMPMILLLSAICLLRWKRQPIIQKWLNGGLLLVSFSWFALMTAIAWIALERLQSY